MNENEVKNEGMTSEQTEEKDIAVRKNKTADFLAKLCCLLLAFFLWYYAAGSDTSISEDTFTAIPIEIVNDSAFSVLSGDGVTVDLTLTGTRSALRKVSASDLRAYVDMSHITEAGKYKLDIQYELPNGVTLKSSTTSAITVYADNTVAVTVPVKVNVINYTLEDGYTLQKSDIVTDVERVVVTGPETVVNTITHAALTVDIGGYLNGSVTYKGEIALVNGENAAVTNSYVTTNVTTVTATIPVVKERQIPIVVQYKHGYFTHANCEVTPSPAVITVRGEAATVNGIVLIYELDEKTVKDGGTYTYALDLPASVEVVGGVTSVSLHVELKGTATKTLYVPIETENPEGMVCDPIAPLAITFRGPTAQIAALTAADVKAVVDLADLRGTVKVPVTVIVSEPYEGTVYEIYENGGAYTVTVVLHEVTDSGVATESST